MKKMNYEIELELEEQQPFIKYCEANNINLFDIRIKEGREAFYRMFNQTVRKFRSEKYKSLFD